MLSAAARSRLTVVLVGARNPSNIGAAARAMQDFGFTDLRVVNEFAPPFEAAQLEAERGVENPAFAAEPLTAKSAVGAASVMANARRFDSLTEAIADCTLTVGTTAIGSRGLTREVLTLQNAAPKLRAALAAQLTPELETRVALLFGSEKTGLTRQQLSHCELLLTIPLFAPENARHLSMNLGQSVSVCLYELSREGFEGSREIPVLHEAAATAADRERLTEILLRVMAETGYAKRFPANSRETVVRKLVEKLGSSREEAATWMGLFRHILRRTEAANPE